MKMPRCRYRTSLACFISVLLATVSATAATLTVNSIADDGTGTCTVSKCRLRDAILSASPAGTGDTITFSLPANSAITLTSAELLINKNLTINGPGANLLTVQRSADSFRIFHITSGGLNVISGLTIANGNPADSGGGIYNQSNSILTVTGCAISGNSVLSNGAFPSSGGGIYNVNAALTLTNSTISGNTATGGAVALTITMAR